MDTNKIIHDSLEATGKAYCKSLWKKYPSAKFSHAVAEMRIRVMVDLDPASPAYPDLVKHLAHEEDSIAYPEISFVMKKPEKK